MCRSPTGNRFQGFSALLKNPHGGWIAMSDNGFGTKGNSGDFVIGVYRASIDFKSQSLRATLVCKRGRIWPGNVTGSLGAGQVRSGSGSQARRVASR